MKRNLQILAMRTWGELGNLLAARTLASALTSELPGVEVEVLEAEALFPRFARIGAAIEGIAKMPCEPAERHGNYLSFMTQLEEVFPHDLEARERPLGMLDPELDRLVEHFGSTRPDLVVGTKGVISRLCLAALRRAGLDVPVVNFVTNEGLLRLPIHRSAALAHNLVPFESARRYLLVEHAFLPERVQVVGRLIAQPELARFVEHGGPTEMPAECPADVRVLVLSNRGGEPYLRLLRHLAEWYPELPVIFIGYNDPPLCEAAERLRREQSLPRWRIFSKLGQGDYLRYLCWLTESNCPMLVSKTGPNTMCEAAYFGVPQLLLYSGLPMEDWVIPFLHELDLGRGFDTMEKLISAMEDWLQHPADVVRMKEGARRFATTTMDQVRTRRRIGAIFAELLSMSGTHGRDQCSPGPQKALDPSS